MAPQESSGGGRDGRGSRSARGNTTQPSILDGETPKAALIAKIDAERLGVEIEALPTPFRETLVLRDVEGHNCREIAEATEVPIGTVMSRLARARSRLMATIEGKP
jgi:RNA polymerase sigma-70 factor (ECF subfamily)